MTTKQQNETDKTASSETVFATTSSSEAASSEDAPSRSIEEPDTSDVSQLLGTRAATHFEGRYQTRSSCHILVDSCADFTAGVARRLGVEVIEFPFVMSDGEHLSDLWQSMSPHEFYERMREGEQVSTSAVSPGRYFEIFEQAAKRGKPTIYLGFTAGLSSSIYAAEDAAERIRELYPNFELYVVDNACPSAAAELLAIECVRMAASGTVARDIVDWANEAKYFIHGYFTLDTFDALARGGRIPPAAAQVGGKLDVKPELSYDIHGALTLKGMCRGRKKALRAIVNEFRDNFAADSSLPIAIVSSDAEKDADWLELAIRKEPGCEDLAVIRGSVSPTIGAHVGPGMVALIFWGNDRRQHSSLTDRIARRVKRGIAADTD